MTTLKVSAPNLTLLSLGFAFMNATTDPDVCLKYEEPDRANPPKLVTLPLKTDDPVTVIPAGNSANPSTLIDPEKYDAVCANTVDTILAKLAVIALFAFKAWLDEIDLSAKLDDTEGTGGAHDALVAKLDDVADNAVLELLAFNA